MAVGTLFGLINGVIINAGKITPFVVTLGMMSIARGITMIYTKGYPISGFDAGFPKIGGGAFLGIPVPIMMFVVSAAAVSSLILTSRLNSAEPIAGTGYELDVIAAVVIGGSVGSPAGLMISEGSGTMNAGVRWTMGKTVIQRAFDSGRGILRLTPAWVPREFCVPGRRIKLHPDDYYALGGAARGDR